MNKTYWWWLLHPTHWLLFLQRNRLREILALKLIPFLSKAEQATDHIVPTTTIVKVVHAMEYGEALNDDSAALWSRANTDPSLTRIATDLREASLGNALPSTSMYSSAQVRQLRRQSVQGIEFETLSITQHLPVLIPIVSAFFLLSGYVHTVIFFSDFNLPVSNYFGLSDYISASMDGLVATMLAAILAHITFLMQNRRLRLSALQRRLFVNNWGTIFGLIFILLSTAYFFFTRESAEEFRAIAIYAILVSVGSSVSPFVAAYSRRPNATLLLSNFIVLYAALMWFLTNIEVQQLSRPAKVDTKIVLNDDAGTVLEQRIIAGNSLYLFLLNEKRDLVILPIDNIRDINQTQRVDGKSKP